MTVRSHRRTRVLLLGGTAEASALAVRLAGDRRFETVLSLAGRTANPNPVPVARRIGGFGGVDGLTAYLEKHVVDLLIDATHPFATQISRHAIAACRAASCPLLAVERPPWRPQPGDRWTIVATIEAAVAALKHAPRRVFAGIGRLSLAALRAAPQHRYVLRLVDPPSEPLGLPNVTVIVARGPFAAEDDLRLFRETGVDVVLSKNSGGTAAVSKIEAARTLGLPVIMIDRPAGPVRPTVATVDAAWEWLETHQASVAKRGV
ncbi:MAG: cobalt-precorrin-6A reductase [Hyphomicrobiaceae bacterium]